MPVWRSLPGSSACVPQARGRIHPLSPQAGPGRDFWGPSSSFPKGKGLQEQLGSRTAPAGGRASSSVLGGKQSPGEGKEVRSLRSPQLPSLPSSSCLSPACQSRPSLLASLSCLHWIRSLLAAEFCLWLTTGPSSRGQKATDSGKDAPPGQALGAGSELQERYHPQGEPTRD